LIRCFARISVKTDESQSIAQQRRKLGQWAELHHEGEPIEWYVDEGISGSKRGIRRPERDRLLRDLGRGDVLSALKVDRLARSTRDLLDIVHLAEERGASVVFVEQGIDTSGPYGRFMLTLLAAIAELEAGIISERVAAAREEFALNGRHTGRLPVGFHSEKHPEHGWLVVRPHPQDGPRVKAAVVDVLAGESQRRAAEKLGIAPGTFRDLLRNPRLYGQAPGGKLDPEAALITRVEFRRLQQTMGIGPTKSKAPGYGKALRCYGCEHRLYYARTDSLPDPRYQCRHLHPGKVAILAEIVDEYVEDWFLSRYGDAPMMTGVWEGEDDRERMEALSAVEIELEEVSRSLVRPGADIASLTDRVQALHLERERLQNEPVRGRWAMIRTGETVREHWATSDDDERSVMLSQVATFVIHPRGRDGGRIEAIPLDGGEDSDTELVISAEDQGWLEDQGLA
jgi:DNA invertase Pin-like site-specific DNA recombinase